MNKGASFEQEDHQRYKEKSEVTTLQQDDDARWKVEVESVPSSKNVKAGARATDAGKAAQLQNSTSVSVANNAKAESKHDSQVVIIDRANITVGKPPAASSTAGSGRPPAAAGIRKSGKPDGLHNERNVHPDNCRGLQRLPLRGVAGWPLRDYSSPWEGRVLKSRWGKGS